MEGTRTSSLAATHPTDTRDADSMSDSDWLDVASGRDSEDAESIVDRLSRRSSMSFTGTSDSAGNAISERWEGLIDDRDSEDEFVIEQPASDAVPPREIDRPGDAAADEENVKAALDQSMISTLSSSRSSSHSFGWASRRDVRLSFPDPILSNSVPACTSEERDDLNHSYDRISRSESDLELGSRGDAPMTLDDLGIIPTPEVIPQVEPASPGVLVDADLNIVLYGCSSPVKVTLVDDILRKVAAASGALLSSPASSARVLEDGELGTRGIIITDRTVPTIRDADVMSSLESSPYTPDRFHTSLAIVYLPSSITRESIEEHTFYLPVLVPPACIINSFSEEVERHAARQRWNMLSIPESKVLRLTPSRDGDLVPGIVNAQDVEEMSAGDVRDAIEALFAQPSTPLPKKKAYLRDLGTKVNVLAVLTVLLSVLLTYTLKDVGHHLLPTTRGGSPTVETLNESASVPQPAAVPLAEGDLTKALIPSSVKDFALAIFDPASPSSSSSYLPPVSTRAAVKSGVAVGKDAAAHCISGRGPPMQVPLTDLMVRPETQVPALNSAAAGVSKALSVIAPSQAGTSSSWKGKGKAKEEEPMDVTALSLRVIGSLVEWFDIQAVLEGVGRDVKELVDALEELMTMIGDMVAQGRKSLLSLVASMERPRKETPVQVSERKGLAGVVGEKHSRAKQRAREIKEAGQKWVLSSMAERADRARKQAKVLTGQVSGHADVSKGAYEAKRDLKQLSKGILEYLL
ncbi:hypothetical protein OE88DRAFT_1665436 [Heliocybe sulcata]|uniref:Uncharacterized protein n=1 Tax=Heliocybe sulcata TaxID=5364 RepID=A0A5C3N249_9AGAM|nr:hypothetical protein OE88DRAFT_1665436 [Heliocybe sulcata]